MIVTEFAGILNVVFSLVRLSKDTPPSLVQRTNRLPAGAFAVTVTVSPYLAFALSAVPPMTVTEYSISL